MDRRKFLTWLGGSAAGVAAAQVLDVEKLLWMPGEKTVFLPPAQVVLPPAQAMFTGIDWAHSTRDITAIQIRATDEYFLELARRQVEQDVRLSNKAGRYVVTVGATGVMGAAQVVYDEDWNAVRGAHYSHHLSRAMEPEQLAWLGEKMRDPASMKLSAEAIYGTRSVRAAVTPERFAEIIRGDFSQLDVPGLLAVGADADSRPGEFVEYENGLVKNRKAG